MSLGFYAICIVVYTDGDFVRGFTDLKHYK